MTLLENLLPGSIYLVKISASNQVGDGPFSKAVEVAVVPGGSQSGHHPRRSGGSAEAKGQWKYIRRCADYLLRVLLAEGVGDTEGKK